MRVYFLHDTLTPGNVRETWHMPPGANPPAVGDIIEFVDAGFEGARVEWAVTRRKWLGGGNGIELTMTGPDGEGK